MNWSGIILKKCLYIIVVSLNPGKRLRETLDSIFSQTADDYRIIIKDGGSEDGALQALIDEGYFKEHDNVKTVVKPDRSIYDGMNQAVEIMLEDIPNDEGYCLFMNCGDTFYDEKVLDKVMKELRKSYDRPHIIYGDQYNILQNTVVSSAPGINEFTLYRNVPCHQVCFYDIRLFKNRAYNTKYTVRADYEHFLYCCYKEEAICEHIDVIICNYEGGGYSETKENRKKSAAQHREITDIYMGDRAGRYRLIMLLTLAPLRTKIAENPRLSNMYNALKSKIYRGNN